MCKVVLFAPFIIDLPYVVGEAYRISAVLNTDWIDPIATPTTVRNLLPAKTGDILWMATHAGKDGIYLGEEFGSKEFLTATQLAQITSRMRLKGIVLNACSSGDIARDINNATGIPVIAQLNDLYDIDALSGGILLASAIAELHDFRRAYDQVAVGDHNFVFEPPYIKSVPLKTASAPEVAMSSQQADRKLEQLFLTIFGDQSIGFTGLADDFRGFQQNMLDQVEKVQRDISALRNDLKEDRDERDRRWEEQRRQQRNNIRIFIIMSIILIPMAIGIIYLLAASALP